MRQASDEDAGILVDWHADPDVSIYWDDELFTRDDIVARLARSDVHAYIVEEHGMPVGYLQAWFETEQDGSERCGLDMFLVPSARGRGLGPDAAKTLRRWLFDAGFYEVLVDPYIKNARAVRAWQRAGFEIVEERPADDEHLHPWLLMVARAGPDS